MRISRLLSFFVLLLPLQTFAEVYDVSTTAELREALASAAEAGGDNTIRLAAGTYSTQDDGEGTFKYASTAGGSLSITSDSGEEAILDGASIDMALEVLTPTDKPLTRLELINFSMQNSVIAISVSHTDLVILSDMTFRSNQTRVVGLYDSTLETRLEVRHSLFESNQCPVRAPYDDLLVIDSTFRENTCDDNGGAIYGNVDGSANVENSVFIGNRSDKWGGAVANVTQVFGSHFESNFARLNGGAIQRRDGFNRLMTIEGNRFVTNSCGRSSTCSVMVGPAHISNNIFINDGDSDEGDISSFAEGSYGTLVSNNLIVDTNFSASTANGEIEFTNNVFLGGSGIKTGSGFISMNNNYLNEDNLGPERLIDGSGNIFEGVNLGFVNAEEGDYRLTSSSDLIDAGTTDPELAYITDYDYTGTTARVIGASVDIGPYEYDGDAPPDSDGDGLNDNIDNCPEIANEDQADNDSDGEGDACDSDDDNDGTNDEDDAFPFDASESLDTDGDGIGNNEDYDDDADGILDSFDNAPLVVNAIVVDSDNDGVIDSVDAYPNDPTKQYLGSGDLDGDGYSNDEEVDYCTNPFDKNSQPDIGGLSMPMIHLLTDQ